MPPLGPIKGKDLVRCLKRLDFEGPYSGGKHQFMVKGDITIHIPNPHHTDIGVGFLARILRQAKVSEDEWEKL